MSLLERILYCGRVKIRLSLVESEYRGMIDLTCKLVWVQDIVTVCARDSDEAIL